MNNCIYFISDGGNAIKIGISSQVKKRLATISTSNGQKISLIASIVGTKAQERSLHAALGAYHLKGEWFRDRAEVRQAIDDIVADGLAPAASKPQRAPNTETQESLELGAYVLKYAAVKYGATALSRLEDIERDFGLPPRTLWRLRYRPWADVTCGTYFALLKAAMLATSEAQKHLDWDRSAIISIGDVHLARDERIAFLEAEIARHSAVLGPDSPLVRAASALAGEDEGQP